MDKKIQKSHDQVCSKLQLEFAEGKGPKVLSEGHFEQVLSELRESDALIQERLAALEERNARITSALASCSDTHQRLVTWRALLNEI